MGRTDHEDLVTDGERSMVRAMLLALGRTPYEADWMAASCPSMKLARNVCNQDRRRERMPSKQSVRIRDAHDVYRKAIGTPLESQRYAELQAVVREIASGPAQERNQK